MPIRSFAILLLGPSNCDRQRAAWALKLLSIRSAIAFVVLTISSLAVDVSAQTVGSRRVFDRYQQFVWTEQQGLPQNTVQAITRTSDGYLWLGTLAGAVRFDGARFTVFDSSNTDEIKGAI